MHNTIKLPERIDPVRPVLTLGRAPKCDIVLPSPDVAPVHAQLLFHHNRLEVLSLVKKKLRCRTRVNGRAVDRSELRDRDEVDFGSVRYHVIGQHLERKVTAGLDLRVSGLTVDRGDRRLLDGIDLRLASNQFVGILAPSGAGKTTLLKCLAGFFRPNGRLEFDGRELNESTLEAYRESVGYVAQGDLLIPSLTARENLAFAGRLRMAGRVQDREVKAIAEQLLERLGIKPADRNRPVRYLSGGQRRRLNVGLELVGRPRLLLLDEPTTGLDPASETRMMKLLREITGDGTTVACTTHVLENLALFDRVIVLADRQVDYDGHSAGLKAHYGASGYCELYEQLDHKSPRKSGAIRTPAAGYASPSALTVEDDPHSSDGRVVPHGPILSPAEVCVSRSTACLIRARLAAKVRLIDQVRVLTERVFRGLRRDRGWLALTALQPVAIGFLIVLSQLVPSSALVGLTFAVVGAVWLGLNNTAREVVRERALYTRERLLGITPFGYLVSKVVAFGIVGLIQVAVLWLIVSKLNLIPASDTASERIAGWSLLYGIAVLWGAYLGALGLGLMVSALARSEESAVAALPLIVLPQLLLTGVATGFGSVEDRGGFQPVGLTWRAETHPPKPVESFADLPVFGEEKSTAAPPTPAPEPAATGSTRRWVLEACSALTYTRPAVDLLHPRWYYERDEDFELAIADTAHLALAVGLTGLLLIVGFRLVDRKWLREV